MAESGAKQTHYKDWPNAQGFDVRYEERSPTELEVIGTIPAYTAGVLFRNGMGPREVKTSKNATFKVNHWFDHLSQVHRFQIHSPTAEHPTVRVTHSSRLTCDGLIEKIIKQGNRTDFSFGPKFDPCKSFFGKVMSIFAPAAQDNPSDVDVCVTLSTNFPGLSGTGMNLAKGHEADKISTLCNKTDNSTFQMLDPETLEPVGVARQQVLHPSLSGPFSGAHAKFDPVTGDVFNYNLVPGKTGSYRVFTVSAATGKTSVLATIPHAAAYLHSMFLTERHAVLCVWNAFFRAGGAAVLWTKNYIDSMKAFDGNQPATWYVVDRRPVELGGRGLVATYESDAFFCFHTINAYEETSPTDAAQVDIVADLIAYESLDVLQRFYLDNLLSSSPGAKAWSDPAHRGCRPQLRRFRLPDVPAATATATAKSNSKKPRPAVAVFTEERHNTPELPSLNSRVRGMPYRFVYGAQDTGASTFMDGLLKYDVRARAVTHRWSVPGHTAGEPIFVADPDAAAAAGEDAEKAEDAGVLLSVVLDGIAGKSYLLVLDARDMTELGRAKVDGVVGFGFHGTHFPETARAGGLGTE